MSTHQFKIDYYKQVVDLLYIEYLDTKSPMDKEVIVRDILSRAYYCSFLHCREEIGIILGTSSQGSHDKILEELGDYFYTKLNKLRAHRVKADYKFGRISINQRFVDSLLSEMQELISSRKHDLKNKR